MFDDKDLDRNFSDESAVADPLDVENARYSVLAPIPKPDYGFQHGLQDQAFEHLNGPSKTVVLAATPGSGKTEMAIELIRRFVASKPGSRVLVLTHGQTVLRDNFRDRLGGAIQDFTWAVLLGDQVPDVSVHVGLPHYFRNRKLAWAYDLVVVDEAHHFFFAMLVQRILDGCPNRHLLLLTGTPSPFVRAENEKAGTFPLVSMAATELIRHGVLSDPHIELAQVAKPVGLECFNDDDNLLRTVSFTETETQAALTAALERIAARSDQKVSRLALKTLKKTTVICHDQDQARQALAHFENQGVLAALSTSDDDAGSLEIERFTQDAALKVLVVVNRGTLGFNYPDLVNVIDISFTHNPDRLFQSLGRVVRRSQLGEEKVFIKVTTPELLDLTHVVMSFTVALSLPNFFNNYDGCWKRRPVPIAKISPKRDVTPGCRRTSNGSGLAVDEIGLPRLLTFSELERTNGEACDAFAFTTFEQVRARLSGLVRWSNEDLMNDAKKYKTRTEWQHAGSGYQIARTRGNEFLETCCEHMKIPRNRRWTDAEIRADALKYKTRKGWQQASSGYKIARRRGNEFLNECCQHMGPSRHRRRTDAEIKADALKYQTRSAWQLEGTCYSVAHRRGPQFFEECCQHMGLPKHRRWTDAELKADALNYQTRIEWERGSSGYAVARRRAKTFFRECCLHMA